MPVHRFEVELRAGLPDPQGLRIENRLRTWLGLEPGAVRTRRVYRIDAAIEAGEASAILDALVDPVAEVGAVGLLPDPAGAPWIVTVGYLPGVTDSVGATVLRAAEDRLGRALDGHGYSAVAYFLFGLDRAQVDRAVAEVLHNPLVERARVEHGQRHESDDVPRVGTARAPEVHTVPIRRADDAELVRLSQAGCWALSLPELHAIRDHFAGLDRDPTDAELECLAQTWSEHCKHKIFAAEIDHVGPDGRRRRIDGLFRTFVRGATEAVAAERARAGLDPPDRPFLVSVFHDNAGVVRFSEADHLVYKVETHNSPSALDPYGGAMTGIVGVNRDSFGTGIGADPLANVWGFCLGPPDHAEPLPRGLMHPRRIREGVHAGVIDGGNQSGIPMARGFELFDPRYVGKPLVYCGTVAAMPVTSAGRPTHEKRARPGDRIVMVGGRIGKDGIHGATFSSAELDESAPVQAVQIGDPITQKMMFDMLTEARDRGLVRSMTDNGAGGLSSSVGEMATQSGGARLDLALAPLKYPGLMPWEILVSEAQERMTVAVAPEDVGAFLELARRREVEATVLGEFTADGRLHATHGATPVVDLPLEFVHDGVPRGRLTARHRAPTPLSAPAAEAARAGWAAIDVTRALPALLARPGIASLEPLMRRYDHEVKGLSVVKPLVGSGRDVPATATVMRVRHRRDEAVVLAEGIHPFYGEDDAHAMATAAVDEAVRRVLCAGARWDRMAALDNFCWPDPLPGPGNPDAEHKLAQLVRCCEGLYDACVAYGVPLVSGKDSMKNDARLGGVKISIPPTLLVSVLGQMLEAGRALDLRPRAEGHDCWLIGPTRAELGGSELGRMHGLPGTAPVTVLAEGRARYLAFVDARDRGLFASTHALGRGGLALALVHTVLAEATLGLRLDLDPAALGVVTAVEALFSESTGRLLVTAAPEHHDAIVRALEPHGLHRLGKVVAEPVLDLGAVGRFTTAELRRAYVSGGSP